MHIECRSTACIRVFDVCKRRMNRRFIQKTLIPKHLALDRKNRSLLDIMQYIGLVLGDHVEPQADTEVIAPEAKIQALDTVMHGSPPLKG